MLQSRAIFGTSDYASDQIASTLRDGAGNTFIVSQSYFTVYVTKYGSSFQQVWQTHFISKTSSQLTALTAALDNAGNVIVFSIGSTAPELEKVNGSTGALVWQKKFTNEFSQFAVGRIIFDTSNNIYLLGDTQIAKFATSGNFTSVNSITGTLSAVDSANNLITTDTAFTLRKYNLAGQLAWTYSYGGNQPQIADVVTDPAGNVYATGSVITSSFYHSVTLKVIGSTGTKLWDTVRTFGGGAAGSLKMTVDPVSGAVFTCNTNDIYSGQTVVDRLDPATGATQWVSHNPLPVLGPTYVRQMIGDSNGGVLMGLAVNYNTTNTGSITHISSAGALLYAKDFGPDNVVGCPTIFRLNAASDQMDMSYNLKTVLYNADAVVDRRQISTCDSVNAVQLGTIYQKPDDILRTATLRDGGFVSLLSDYSVSSTIARFDSSGNTVYASTYPVQKTPNGIVAIGSNGDGSLTGYEVDHDNVSGHSLSVFTKFSEKHGTPLWKVTLQEFDTAEFSQASIQYDQTGDIYLVLNASSAARVFKLKARDGTVLWQKDYAGINFLDRDSTCVLPSGDLIIAATQAASVNEAVLRINSQTGNVVFTRVITPLSSGSAKLLTAACDSKGEIFVSGLSGATPSLLKLNGTTGATIWSSGNPIFKLDPQGNVFSAHSDGYHAYASKTDGKTGLEVWSVVLPTTTPSYSSSTFMVDRFGNVILAAYPYNSPLVLPVAVYAFAFDGAFSWSYTDENASVGMGKPFQIVDAGDKGIGIIGNNEIYGDGGNRDLVYSLISPKSADRTISGKVLIGDYKGDKTSVPITVEITANGSAATTTASFNVASDGAFTLPVTLPDGKYKLLFKGSHWLHKQILNVQMGKNISTVLAVFQIKNGDVDGNNVVNQADVDLVIAALGSRPGDANWNAAADVDGNGKVNENDQAIVVKNLGLTGS